MAQIILAFVVSLLALFQVYTFTLIVASCKGGCSGASVPLVWIGALALVSLLIVRSALTQLKRASVIVKTLSVLLLLPGAMVSVAGLLISGYALVWFTLKSGGYIP